MGSATLVGGGEGRGRKSASTGCVSNVLWLASKV